MVTDKREGFRRCIFTRLELMWKVYSPGGHFELDPVRALYREVLRSALTEITNDPEGDGEELVVSGYNVGNEA